MLAKAAKPTSTKALVLAFKVLDSRGLTSRAVERVKEGVP
jgi:hypothetical protein